MPLSSAIPVRWAAFGAAGAGIIGVLAFPTYGWWPVAFVSVAGLSVAVDGRRARTGAWLGYLYGLGFLLPLLHWTGIYVGPVPWLILCAAFAAFFAGLGAVLTVVQRLPGAAVWIGAAWVLQEFLRDRVPFGGFPWGRLAFSQAASPLRWFAALGGAPLVTFAVALCGGGLFALVRARSRTAVAVSVATALAIPVLGLAIGPVLDPGPGHRTLRVALIQGGLPDIASLDFEQRARQVLDNHVRQTLILAARIRNGTQPRPDLVLWPENASDVDPIQDPLARAEVTRAVRAVGAPILVGAIRFSSNGKYRLNEGILWSPTTGPGKSYLKRHPVPFAEYIPLRGIAEAVSSDAKLVSKDMVAGGGNGLITGGPVPIGDVICFEVAYDDLVESSVDAGAQVLVVQTNNATFGHTAETYQQLAMSRLRAVETGREVLQVATTGVSAIIAPDGSVEHQSGRLFDPAILTADIAPRTATTLAVRVGAIPEYLLAVIALGAVGAAIRMRRRAGTDTKTTPGDRQEVAVVSS